MCVACVIYGTLTEDQIRAMVRANPDGNGLAWQDGPHVMFRKGLTIDEVIALVPILPRPFLFHARIATRGGTRPELTHPFPLGIEAFDPDLTGMTTRGVLIHNGTWFGFEHLIPGGIEKWKVSDTQVAAYLAGLDENVLDDVRWSNAIMRPRAAGKASITVRGQWTKKEHEYPIAGVGIAKRVNLYSNMIWDRPAPVYFTSRTYTPSARTPSHSAYDSGEYGEAWERWYNRKDTPVIGVPHARAVRPLPPTPAGTKRKRKDAKRARRMERITARKRGDTVVPISTVEDLARSAKRAAIEDGHTIVPGLNAPTPASVYRRESPGEAYLRIYGRDMGTPLVPVSRLSDSDRALVASARREASIRDGEPCPLCRHYVCQCDGGNDVPELSLDDALADSDGIPIPLDERETERIIRPTIERAPIALDVAHPQLVIPDLGEGESDPAKGHGESAYLHPDWGAFVNGGES